MISCVPFVDLVYVPHWILTIKTFLNIQKIIHQIKKQLITIIRKTATKEDKTWKIPLDLSSPRVLGNLIGELKEDVI